MLPREDNDLLTQVGPEKPLGKLMRHYWLPALLSEEIPEPDCPPVRVRLLGENLVAFRDSQGRVGLLGEHCAHRGTSLFFGRNEECGLRCIYHGWKYAVDGTVLETPAEPSGSTLKDKVRQTAYPCKEAAGIVWSYLGPPDKLPLLPNYEWMHLPRKNLYVTKSVQDCSWLQGLEGECDSSHLSFLHKNFTGERPRGGGDGALYAADSAPQLQGIEMDYGVRMLSCRKIAPDTVYLRVSNIVLPCHGFIPTGGLKGNPEGYTIHSHVPIDDSHSMRYNMHFRRNRAIEDDERQHDEEIGSDFHKRRNLANNYLQDREEQKHENFTGMGPIFLVHDSCATESMGPIYDRAQEHLGVSDMTVIAVRRFLLRAVRAVAAGQEPPHVIRTEAQNDLRHLACIASKIPAHWDPNLYVTEQLKKENYWETNS
ncbi:MAG TPA: Rieske 2Fe-2S domain-containing protein [Candidatus Binatia bacterium]|nr:Rieske 2Fe-2S domain-containing protein [Candidatus Binatia bacterium]